MTFAHLLNNLAELIEKFEENDIITEKLRKREMIKEIGSKSFDNEIDAALAYDEIAILLYENNAVLNFHYPSVQVDSEGKIPLKLSKYKGVRFNNIMKSWQIDTSCLKIH